MFEFCSGKTLAAFLKAIGYIIPLMDETYASYYCREVMVVLVREFASPDEEMKKIVLKVVKQCVQTSGVEADYIRKVSTSNEHSELFFASAHSVQKSSVLFCSCIFGDVFVFVAGAVA
jgi:hypothetical protein